MPEMLPAQSSLLKPIPLSVRRTVVTTESGKTVQGWRLTPLPLGPASARTVLQVKEVYKE